MWKIRISAPNLSYTEQNLNFEWQTEPDIGIYKTISRSWIYDLCWILNWTSTVKMDTHSHKHKMKNEKYGRRKIKKWTRRMWNEKEMHVWGAHISECIWITMCRRSTSTCDMCILECNWQLILRYWIKIYRKWMLNHNETMQQQPDKVEKEEVKKATTTKNETINETVDAANGHACGILFLLLL